MLNHLLIFTNEKISSQHKTRVCGNCMILADCLLNQLMDQIVCVLVDPELFLVEVRPAILMKCYQNLVQLPSFYDIF